MRYAVVTRLRPIALFAAAACALCLPEGASATSALPKSRAMPMPSVTRTSPLTRGSSYLALGDSVSFGYQEPATVPGPDYANARSFVGYPEQIARQLHVRVTNLACPGETSASLINVSAPTLACENAYRKNFPLHVRYRGSQLAYAVSFLHRHPGVRLVSLMIGANDGLHCQIVTADHCTSTAEQQAVLGQISRNVRRILSAIRGKAHYAGQIAILSYYALNYASFTSTTESRTLNHTVDSAARPFHVVYANGYRAFQIGSVKYGNQPCQAGLITELNSTVGDCGIHPTYAGQALLAAAVLKAIRL